MEFAAGFMETQRILLLSYVDLRSKLTVVCTAFSLNLFITRAKKIASVSILASALASVSIQFVPRH